jgi:hypothetical protein
MVRRRERAVSNHEAPAVAFILRDAANAAPQDEEIEGALPPLLR